MSKGIVYYKLQSQYEDDITKDCGLDGYEVDCNFNTLEGRDIKTLQVIDDDIVITLYNGKTLSAKQSKDKEAITSITFDKENGILSYTQDNITYNISGFSTTQKTDLEVFSDASLKGKGTFKKPLGLSNSVRTGVYKPVKRVIDYTRREKLPQPNVVAAGDRFLTIEAVSNYGYLYDLDGVKNIACDLRDTYSKWRIPTLEDWDDMLNAVEPNPEDRNHGSLDDNRNLGKWAGKILKSVNLWTKQGNRKSCDETAKTCIDYGVKSDDDECACGKDIDCAPVYCGEYSDCDFRPKADNSGIDTFGFRVTPAGYADDGENYLYFKDRAFFWTSANHHRNNAYTKRFDFNRSTVHQEILAAQNHLSLRLVKEYTGDNFFDTEDILDTTCNCVLMPSIEAGHKVWTSVNFASPNRKYKGLLPNDGAGVTNMQHFFINEWDGKRWTRNEMREGEGVVIIDAPRGKVCEEYRVIEGRLTSVSEAVKESALSIVRADLIKIKSRLDRDEEEFNVTVGELRGEIEEIKEIASEVTDVKTALETETEERKAEDEKLEEEITAVSENLTEAVNTINETIATETEERKAADEALQEEIDKIDEANKDIMAKATDNGTIAFDGETGLFTATTIDGTTTQSVQFSFDFGKF